MKISIVIPLYNNVEYIEETLCSLQRQSFTKWQCIIVDDGSSDGSVEIVMKMTKDDKRLKFLIRENFTEKTGANACRNIGLGNLSTDYVMFLDADDYLDVDCLMNRMQNVEKRGRADLYIFKTAFVNKEGGIIGYFYNRSQEIQDVIYRLVTHKIPWHTMSPIWSVKFLKEIGGWNEDYERLQDVELHIRALLSNPVIFFADVAADSFYRFNGMSLEKKKAARKGFCRLVKDYHKRLLQSSQLNDSYKKKINEKFEIILENQFLNYIKNTEKRDFEWERLYLSTLRTVEIDADEQVSVQYIFSKL